MHKTTENKSLIIQSFTGCLSFFALLVLLSAPANAAWTSPTETPPSGNVAPPIFASSTVLQIIGADGDGGALKLLNTGSTGSAMLQLESLTNASPWTLFSMQDSADGQGDFHIRYGTGDEIFTIDKSGSVGVGTTTPGETFAVEGSAIISSTFKVGGESFFGDAVNLQENLIVNIGNDLTDFTSGGGLNLAGDLDVTGTLDVTDESNLASTTISDLTITGAFTVNDTVSTSTIENDLWVKRGLKIGPSSLYITQNSLQFNETATISAGDGAITLEPAGSVSVAVPAGQTFAVNDYNGEPVIYIDSDSGKVGIGTTTEPEYPIDLTDDGESAIINVQDTIGDLWTGMRLERSGEKWFVGMGSSTNDMLFRSDSANNDVVIDVAGNLGVGTSSPSALVTVGNNNQFTVTSAGNVDATALTLDNTLPVNQGGTGWRAFNSGSILFGNAGNSIATSSDIYWDDANSRLGIASSSPNYRLSLSDNFSVDTGGNVIATKFSGAIDIAGNLDMKNNWIYNIGSDGTFFNSTGGLTLADPLEIIDTTGTTTIEGGKIGVGTLAPATELEVYGTASTTDLVVTGNTTLDNLIASRILVLDGDKKIQSTQLSSWVLQNSADEIIVTENAGNGTVTLSTPQGINTTNSPEFVDLTLTGKIDSSLASATSTFAGGMTVDGDTLVVNYESNKVGIGTDTPEEELHVIGDIKVTGTSYLGNIVIEADTVTFDNATTTDLANAMTFSAGGSQRVTILANGNVGIGTTNPVKNLEIQSPAASTPSLRLSREGVSQAWDINSNPNLSFKYNSNDRMVLEAGGDFGIGTTNPTQLFQVGDQFTVSSGADVQTETLSVNDGTATTTLAGSLVVDTDSLVVDRVNNRVGIGNATPATPLHIKNAGGDLVRLEATDSDQNSLTNYLGSGSGAGMVVGISGADSTYDGMMWMYDNKSLRFGTGGSQRVVIDSDGYVGIGSTSPSKLLSVATDFSVSATGDVEATNLDLSTLTAGSVLFATSSGRISQDNINMSWDDAGNRLTVTNLTVTDTSNLGEIVIKQDLINFNKASTTASGEAMQFFADGTERLTILSGGNIGVSSTTPSQLLSVGDNAYVNTDGDAWFAGDLSVGGNFGLSGDLDMNNNLVLNIGNANTDFSTNGFNLAGDFDINSGQFTVASTSGNTNIAGTLDVTGLASLNNGIAVDTNAFTVAGDGTGNTNIAGTLDVANATTLLNTLDVTGLASLNNGIAVDTNAFTVAGDGTGNTGIAGTLGVTNATTLSNTLNVLATSTLNGIVVDGTKFVVEDGTGNTSVGGTLDVAGNTTISATASTSDLVVSGSTTLNSLSSDRLMYLNGSNQITSTDAVNWVTGTTNQLTVTDDADGTITLSTPQNIHSGATPTFASTTLTNFTASSVPFFGAGGVLSENNSNFSWDNINNRLTVENLIVNDTSNLGEVEIKADIIKYNIASTTEAGKTMQFFTDGTESLTILPGGDVGIGSTTPNSLLSVGNNANITSTGAARFAANVDIEGGLDVIGANLTLDSNDLVINGGLFEVDGGTGSTTIASALDVTGLITTLGGLTTGANIVSDTDSTDTIGLDGTRFLNVFSDEVTTDVLDFNGGSTADQIQIPNGTTDALSVKYNGGTNFMTFNTMDERLQLDVASLFMGSTNRFTGTVDIDSALNVDSTGHFDGTIDTDSDLLVDGDAGIGSSTMNAKLGVLSTTDNQWAGQFIGDESFEKSYGLKVQGGTNQNDTAFDVTNVTDSQSYFNIRGDGYITTDKSLVLGSDSGRNSGAGVAGELRWSNDVLSINDGSDWLALTGVWKEGSNNLVYYEEGNIRIGSTTDSENLLDISFGNGAVVSSSTLSSNSVEGIRIVNASESNNNGAALYFESAGGSGKTAIVHKQNGGVLNSAGLHFYTENLGAFDERMRIDSDGNLGLGSSTPSQLLSVADEFYVTTGGAVDAASLTLDTQLAVSEGGTGQIEFNVGSLLFGDGSNPLATSSSLFWNSSESRLEIPNIQVTGTSTLGNVVISSDVVSYNVASTTEAGKTMAFRTDSTERLTILSGGNIGIGSTTPNALLSVADDFSVTTGGLTTTENLFVNATTTTDNLVVTGNTVMNNNLDYIVKVADGAIIEPFSLVASSSAGTVSLKLEQDGGGDLTVLIGGLSYIFDATPIASIDLDAGSDTSPTLNYVYIDSGMSLVANTTGFPDSDHAPVATVLVQDPASVATDGVYKLHAWTDHVYNGADGHLTHVNSWIRQQHATWLEGTNATINEGIGNDLTAIHISVDSGKVAQLHEQTFPSFDTDNGDVIYVRNYNGQSYKAVTDLATLLEDSEGGSLDKDYYSLVLWGVVSENEEDSKLFLNLPSGSYDRESQLIADAKKYANYTVPQAFKGTAFMIARLDIDNDTTDWDIVGVEDLRGQLPSIFAGGTTGQTTEFADNSFLIYDEADVDRLMKFDLGSITTGSTTLITVPNKNGTLAMISDVQEITNFDLTDGNFMIGSQANKATSTSNIFFDNTNTRFGVGTTTPNKTMSVAGDLEVTGCFGPIYSSTSTASYVGDVGGLPGYTNANATCAADEHICSEAEIMNTMACSASLPNSGSYWINGGSASDVANDCSGWNASSSSAYGSFWNFDDNSSMLTVCSNSLPYACCK